MLFVLKIDDIFEKRKSQSKKLKGVIFFIYNIDIFYIYIYMCVCVIMYYLKLFLVNVTDKKNL